MKRHRERADERIDIAHDIPDGMGVIEATNNPVESACCSLALCRACADSRLCLPLAGAGPNLD